MHLENLSSSNKYKYMNLYANYSTYRKGKSMEDYIENDEEGNIFELIAEECYLDDEWREENGG